MYSNVTEAITAKGYSMFLNSWLIVNEGNRLLMIGVSNVKE